MDPENRTTATAILLDAIGAYRESHGIPPWEDDLLQIAEPGEDLYDEWRNAHRMDGDPAQSEIAMRCDGFGTFYGSVEAAVADVRSYFCEDDPEPGLQ